MSEKSFAEILKELSKPFDPKVVQFRPGRKNKKVGATEALALAFVDPREYQQRLDDVVGSEWSVRVEPLGNNALKVSLTIMGVTREDVGEGDPDDDNTYTTAFAQGFKRACAAFGLGRYLYRLPKAWVAYDAERKKLLETPALPKWAVPEGAAYIPPVSQDEVERVASDRGLPTEQPRSVQHRRTSNGNPADVVVKFGKYKGKTLGDILSQDKGYLEWLAEKSSNQFIAGKARQLLEAAPIEPATEAVDDLPVAAVPEPETVNGNGAGGYSDFDDDIPF